jgi:hypothetical protein
LAFAMSFTEKLVNAFLGFSIFTPGYLAFQFGCESHPEVGHTLRILVISSAGRANSSQDA